MFPSSKHVVLLHVDGHVIKAKADHPFFTSNGWVDAADLRVGDLLRTHNGFLATVQAVEVEEWPVHQLAPGLILYPTRGGPAGTLIPNSTRSKKLEDLE